MLEGPRLQEGEGATQYSILKNLPLDTSPLRWLLRYRGEGQRGEGQRVPDSRRGRGGYSILNTKESTPGPLRGRPSPLKWLLR